MADDAQDTDMALDIHSQIKSSIEARSSYFLNQADSLTFEKVRRLLEKDLGLETHALDTHKRFVKQCLESCMESATSGLSKSQVDAGDNAELSTEEAQPVDEIQVKNEVEEPCSGSAETKEDSPVMGLMTGSKKAKIDIESEDTESKAVPSEKTIRKAIWDRASYLRENSENITLAGLRRLLEEDLKLEKHSLDPFKKFVGGQVDEVLNSPEVPQTNVSVKKKNPKKGSTQKVSTNSQKEETPASSGSGSDEVEEEEVKARKRTAPKGKPQKTEAVRKRKKSEEDSKVAERKQSKVLKTASDGSGEEDGGDISQHDNSDSSAEKPVKKKEVPKPSYGKQVERLKSIIKSCGLSISPAVYKKVKQAPENKREACLIKELEGILSKEGLSSNPSEKEIKDVKKRKEKAKELEGIDLSNIVSSGRRRSNTSFIPPPKPEIPDISESESEDSEDDDDGADDEEEEDEEVENEEADEDQENGDNDSQSEESDKGYT
ncbi:HIRA-interacting protein 3 [Bienertia sinuspersici]